ncbi:MAG: ferritin [Bacteroidetes bacterium]|nr:MAG: ferritin [Bacteroidota bacterium]
MISKKVVSALIKQIQLEEQSSRIYMAMASWCEINGFQGAANFLYNHSDEERTHMTKLIKYVNDKGGYSILQSLEMPENNFKNLLEVFEKILKHEEFITESINSLFEAAFNEKDFTTSQFLQWYIEEQIEEESMFKGILDKFRLAGNQTGGLFHLDKELDALAIASIQADSVQ